LLRFRVIATFPRHRYVSASSLRFRVIATFPRHRYVSASSLRFRVIAAWPQSHFPYLTKKAAHTLADNERMRMQIQ